MAWLVVDHVIRVDPEFLGLLRSCSKMLGQLLKGNKQIMATLDEAVEAIGKIGPAVNRMEAKLTELLKGKLSPADQAKVDAIFAEANRAVADAEDGIDEADTPPVEPPVEPAP